MVVHQELRGHSSSSALVLMRPDLLNGPHRSAIRNPTYMDVEWFRIGLEDDSQIAAAIDTCLIAQAL